MSDAIQRVVITSPDAVSPEGHDAKMVALVDGAADPAPSDRPAWLPEKFKSPEEMAASYAELEKKQGAAPAPATPPVAPPVDASKEPLKIEAVVPGDAEAAVVKAGLNMADLNSEYAKDGNISEGSYIKLAAAGFDKATVDSYVAGQQALATLYETEVKAATPGGVDKFDEMVAWAKVNMTPTQIDEYNTAVGSGNKDRAKLAVMGLGSAFTAAVGSEPTLVGGRQGTTSVSDVYESIAQMQKDMASKEYKSDPAFRSKVQAKLGRSSIM